MAKILFNKKNDLSTCKANRGAGAYFAELSEVRWGVPCRPARRRQFCESSARRGPITSRARILARVLRLYFRTHWPLKGSSLKMLLFLEPLAWAFITVPAESAELRVSLCRAES